MSFEGETAISQFSGAADSDRIEFLQKLADEFPAMRRTVVGMVGDLNDADDVLQSTCLKLWKNYSQLERKDSFRSWACKAASREAINFLSSKRRRSKRVLSTAAIENLVKCREGAREFLEMRLETLNECIATLNETDQQLVRDVYTRERKIQLLAEKYCTPAKTIYTRLSRLRQKLFDCVNRKLDLSWK
ncbi:sigma-70 family RNA polymerase sigma factor [Calycomorphotria hydatis]|uniref:ECF RNA polymerase sigma factor SigG n=1 Tax=Calycomorphotria hydatis TaxID=2528027 RepID=A0A517TAI5_9PLAN|nr:sigma-70 family RNA polymerase sigma factor [Calycomorphotria hydatis]QDT65391.1 ECF RNA polymerase sigma factor SigG [Calycomorphotria hydatis]